MFSRRYVYETGDETSASDRMNKRISNDLRVSIRNIKNHEVFSHEWAISVEVLQRIASYGVMEEKKAVVDGGNVEDKTLWEREQLCARYVMEEGKMNLLLRMTVRLKEITRQMYSDSSIAENAMKSLQMDTVGLEMRLNIYERCLGALLRVCYNSIEALQVSDTRLLFNHAKEVLLWVMEHDVVVPSVENEEYYQESSVLFYLAAVLRSVDKLSNSSNLLISVGECDLVRIVIDFLLKHVCCITRNTIFAGALFLSALFDTEAYKTHSELYFPSLEDKKKLLVLKSQVVDPLQIAYEEKKEIRGLLDETLRAKFAK